MKPVVRLLMGTLLVVATLSTPTLTAQAAPVLTTSRPRSTVRPIQLATARASATANYDEYVVAHGRLVLADSPAGQAHTREARLPVPNEYGVSNPRDKFRSYYLPKGQRPTNYRIDESGRAHFYGPVQPVTPAQMVARVTQRTPRVTEQAAQTRTHRARRSPRAAATENAPSEPFDADAESQSTVPTSREVADQDTDQTTSPDTATTSVETTKPTTSVPEPSMGRTQRLPQTSERANLPGTVVGLGLLLIIGSWVYRKLTH
ncbi:LPXTG cell wall anchor domain-containing protein [Lactiplantibacillus garii]|uniref:LPXTG cell wall anchor domain-containing protein n=1 Tax=Lactiplantibacillus garii TaxID=2306423 RepID=A0A3R8L143_9LACO|nr:LPXTG cell wall anchor domain-containing protein [Lactiplantibacillus garii]RRK10478.1 LPXTG cell wall anchor domain-containing protein [Lactiplantibacillus garii]